MSQNTNALGRPWTIKNNSIPSASQPCAQKRARFQDNVKRLLFSGLARLGERTREERVSGETCHSVQVTQFLATTADRRTGLSSTRPGTFYSPCWLARSAWVRPRLLPLLRHSTPRSISSLSLCLRACRSLRAR